VKLTVNTIKKPASISDIDMMIELLIAMVEGMEAKCEAQSTQNQCSAK
jgi:hypothetical protein